MNRLKPTETAACPSAHAHAHALYVCGHRVAAACPPRDRRLTAAQVRAELEKAEGWLARAKVHVLALEARSETAETTVELVREGRHLEVVPELSPTCNRHVTDVSPPQVREGRHLEVVPELLPRLTRHVARSEEWAEALDALHEPPQGISP